MYRTFYVVRPKGYLFGLFFLLLVLSCFAAGPIGDVLFAPLSGCAPFLHDSTGGLTMRGEYAPLLREQPRSDKDFYNSAFESGSARVFYRHKNRLLDPSISIMGSHLFGAYRDDQSPYSVEAVSRTLFFDAAALLHPGPFQIGLSLGRAVPRQFDYSLDRQATVSPTTYLLNGPWRFSTQFHYQGDHLGGGLALFSGPVHSSVTTVRNSSNGGNRSFPLTVINRTSELSGAISYEHFSLNLTFGRNSQTQSDQIVAPNAMPTDIALTTYTNRLSGFVIRDAGDSLFWNVLGLLSGGWLSSYNFDRDRFTFFNAEQLRLAGFSLEAGARFNSHLELMLLGTTLRGTAPQGFLKLSPFSAWSLFMPKDYAFTDAFVHLDQAGMRATGVFTFNHLKPELGCAASWFSTRMELDYKEKEIVVLIPIYTNQKHRVLLDKQGILFCPHIALEWSKGQLALESRISQALPLVVGSKSKRSGTSKPSTIQPKNSFRGGTTMQVLLNWTPQVK